MPTGGVHATLGRMTTFALVHGAWHGAWCFEALRTALASHGHDSVAVDLPCDDADAGCEAYADRVADTITGDGHTVVVGHSLGGLSIPLVAERVPIRGLVYLAALLPRIGSSLRDQIRDTDPPPVIQEMLDLEYDEWERHYWPRFKSAQTAFYGDCDPVDAAAAYAELRHQGTRPMTEPFPLDHMPDVPCAYIVCSRDNNVSPQWGRQAARERLGVVPVELASDHSPMLSHPAELAGLLVELADQFPRHS